MITDELLRLSEDQAITATAVSENTIDLGVARDMGEGKPLYVVFTITEAFNTLTSLTIDVVKDTVANLASPEVIVSAGAVALADLALGDQVVLQIPPQIGSLSQRYLGANFTVTGANPTTGKITTDIVETIQDGKKYYASGFSLT